ncbi:hypothetical protein [Clostridium sp. D33t1_170424_F3]|uniref:hypothetical protein n=1 Tax=Clostridium sp. D33t1_170424_F3 TaxID=2787099 RepID=UPI0018A9EB1F|nr:hypothetical protein [Clostridium sp. D33t1_170424_F3]
MKKLMIVLASIDVLLIGMLLMGYPAKWFATVPPEESSSNIMYYTPEEASSQESSGAYAMASGGETYTVRSYQGHIGIFLNDSQFPYDEIDVAVVTLPEADQTLLEQGILVTTREQLNQLIEDYES